jgi:hypothetical protein
MIATNERFKMIVNPSTRQQISEAIKELPADILPELAGFIEYLRFKTALPRAPQKKKEGSAFLQSIAGIGVSEEDDISERDEEILKKEISFVYGWHFNK